jgi:mono/diheme cytochrome c family protein
MATREQRVWAMVGMAMLVAAAGAGAQTRRADKPPAETPPILSPSLAGRDSFDLYCAPCHGTGAKGNGPVARELTNRPADLTLLARQNGGAFPRAQVRDYVTGTGRLLPSHGPAEMPVWGPTFRAFEADARVRERINNLIAYVESLQVATSGAGSDGAQVFRAYCASCHGTTGNGSGPMAEQLRQRPPDLTEFTARNGGVFPAERLTRIIDGRDVASHGDRVMPVWGDAFRVSKGGLSPEQVAARIRAIVEYLAAIQRRNA